MEYQNLAETEAVPGPGATGLYDTEGNVSDGSVDDYGYDWGAPVLYPESARSAGCGNTRSYAGKSGGTTGDGALVIMGSKAEENETLTPFGILCDAIEVGTDADECIENRPAQSDEAAYEIVAP